MGLFGSKTATESVVLIDSDSSSVGGALAHVSKGTQPILYYTIRKTIEAHAHEEQSEALIRTLNSVAEELVSKGGPVLHKETGSGHISRILISVGAPWQKTAVRVEALGNKKPFIFTHQLLAEITQKEKEVPEGYIKSGESVIATLLNGYEVSQPFGKKATRAELVVLSSLINAKVAGAVEEALRKTYHTHALTMTAFAPVAYAVFRDIYPHEKDFLVLDVSDEVTDGVLVKHGVLVDVATIPHGVSELLNNSIDSALQDDKEATRSAEKKWITTIQDMLQSFAATHPLPRTMFLLADSSAHDYLKGILDDPNMRSLWLTTESIRVVPVVAAHFAPFIKTRGDAEADVSLEMLALYASKTV